jgi:hypothetical protein
MDSHTTITYTTHLIGLGPVPAITAENLRIGELTVWNFGYLELVTAIQPKGKTMLALTIKSQNGAISTRNIKRTTLVAVRRSR